MSDTQNKVVLITGGSKGIGRACVEWFAQRNFKVALHYRSGKDTADELCSKFPNCKAFVADLAQSGTAESLVNQVKEVFGGVDVLVNNAGMTLDKLLLFTKESDFDQIMSVNLRPVVVLSKLCAKQMLKKRWGRIINISSVVGHKGNPGQGLYTATKGAITSFTKSIAMELAPAGITVNCVAPGFIATDMTSSLNEKQRDAILSLVPMQRMGSPEEIASSVGFLASEEAAYISGTTLHVNGGMY